MKLFSVLFALAFLVIATPALAVDHSAQRTNSIFVLDGVSRTVVNPGFCVRNAADHFCR